MIIAVYMHLVIPVTIATAMAADVMRQRERPEETDGGGGGGGVTSV